MPRRRNNRNAYGPWAGLPDDVLIMILMQLGFFDFLSFASVCRSWRVVAATHKCNLIAHKQQAFIVIISSYAKKACSFLNIFERRRYKTLLPNLTHKSLLGSSCGYMIMLDRGCYIYIINPLTRDEHTFPLLPRVFQNVCCTKFRAVLVYSPRVSDFQMVAIYRGSHHLIISRPQSPVWHCNTCLISPWGIADLTFFKGKIYVISSNCLIKELFLYPYPFLKDMPVKNNPPLFSSSLQLVASNDRLFVVDYQIGREILVFELEFTKMEWVKTVNLGEEALFLSDIKCSSVINPTTWGGSGNCMYILERMYNRCFVFSLDSRRIGSAQVVGSEEDRIKQQPYMWFWQKINSRVVIAVIFHI